MRYIEVCLMLVWKKWIVSNSCMMPHAWATIASHVHHLFDSFYAKHLLNRFQVSCFTMVLQKICKIHLPSYLPIECLLDPELYMTQCPFVRYFQDSFTRTHIYVHT